MHVFGDFRAELLQSSGSGVALPRGPLPGLTDERHHRIITFPSPWVSAQSGHLGSIT